jgi:hypothetical protein
MCAGARQTQLTACLTKGPGMRHTSHVISLLAAAAAVGAAAPPNVATPGRFEFVVLRPTSSGQERWEMATSASFDSVGVLFTLADIENWSQATGEIRLTAPAAERIANLKWWRPILASAGCLDESAAPAAQ